MNLTEWMLNNLPPEVIEDNVNRKLAELINSRLAIAWDEGYSNCVEINCDNCYSCGSWVGGAANPYRGGAE